MKTSDYFSQNYFENLNELNVIYSPLSKTTIHHCHSTCFNFSKEAEHIQQVVIWLKEVSPSSICYYHHSIILRAGRYIDLTYSANEYQKQYLVDPLLRLRLVDDKKHDLIFDITWDNKLSLLATPFSFPGRNTPQQDFSF